MNTIEKYEDIKVSMLPEKTKDTLEKIKKATKDFTIENEKATAYVNAVHSKLSKEKPEALRSMDKKPEPKKAEPKKSEPKKVEPKKPTAKKPAAKKPEPKVAPKPTPKPKASKAQIKNAKARINALQLALQNDPLLKGLSKTDKERDAGRTALPSGRRISKNGKVYYETRENRSDRKSPEYKDGYPYLADGGYMAKGGSIENQYKGRESEDIWNNLTRGQRLHFLIDHEDDLKLKADGMSMKDYFESRDAITRLKFSELEKKIQEEFSVHTMMGQYADGGEIDDDEGVDLFQDYEDQPEEVSVILSKYELEDNDYDVLEQLLSELEEIGYTFEYGLDGEPYDLRKIGQKGKSEFYAKGGAIENQYQGREAEDIWNNLTFGQRLHFLRDHESDLKLKVDGMPLKDYLEETRVVARLKFSELNKKIQDEFALHTMMGQYGKGGMMEGFTDFEDEQYEVMAKGGEMKTSEKLPHTLSKYFIKGDKTIEVSLDKLSPTRARDKGIANAEKYMRMAYNGEMERRKPITIYSIGKGRYKVADGNSTYAVAKKNGWKTILADVVKNPSAQSKGQKSIFALAKEIRKDGEAWQSAIQRAKQIK